MNWHQMAQLNLYCRGEHCPNKQQCKRYNPDSNTIKNCKGNSSLFIHKNEI